MKKIFIALLLSVNTFSIGFVNKDFKAEITEKGVDYTKVYDIDYKPNDIKITIKSPKVNVGEIYTYKDGKKYIYYPMLKQSVEQSLVNEDTDMVKVLETLKTIDKTTKKGDKEYIVKDGNLNFIKGSGYVITFKYNKDNMPVEIKFLSDNNVVVYTWKY